MNTFPRMHVSLYVSDMQKTIAFYNSFFGQEPQKVRPMYAKYILDKPSLIISFVENKDLLRIKNGFSRILVTWASRLKLPKSCS
jgi:catechol 2,3-dioxygenase-like lactoylglutathione lyase family enzyme